MMVSVKGRQDWRTSLIQNFQFQKILSAFREAESQFSNIKIGKPTCENNYIRFSLFTR